MSGLQGKTWIEQQKTRTLKAAARYLGLRGAASGDPAMSDLLAVAYQRMQEAAVPAHRLVLCQVQVDPLEKWVGLGDLPPVQSRHLARLLRGCSQGYALLATLGMELDLAIKKQMVTDPALAAAMGACGSAYIDVYIDEVLIEEEGRLQEKGQALTPRFSPGYGDAPLSMQPGLLALCGAKTLMVHLTQANLMVPEKSVSAVMGVTKPGADSCPHGCSACVKEDCSFREEEA